MSKAKNAFAVRCHEIGDKEKHLYRYAQAYFGKDNTFFVINNDPKKIKVPEGFNHIIFHHDVILSKDNLFWPRDCGWRCGDYCYYAMHNALSGYDFFWLAEPDVKICCDNPATFFSEFEKKEEDFLATFLGVASSKLFFYPTAKVLEAEPMSGLFPVTRLRADKVSKLYEIRQKVSTRFIKRELMPRDYPNDEIFVATVSRRIGLSCAALDKLSSFDFSLFRSDKFSFFLKEDVKDVKGRFLIHPMLDEKEYIRKKVNNFRNVLQESRELQTWTQSQLKKTGDKKIKEQLREKFIGEFKEFLRKID